MKKIKTINKLLSSLTLLSPLAGIGFNNQYQNTQKVITENSNNSLNNYVANQTNEQRTMGDITVTVDGTTITGFVSSSGEGKLIVDSDITEIGNSAFQFKDIRTLDLSQASSLTTIKQNAFFATNITTLDFRSATNLTSIGNNSFESCSKLTSIYISSGISSIGSSAFIGCAQLNNFEIDSSNKQYSKATNLGNNASVLISGTEGVFGDDTIPVASLAIGDIQIPSSITTIKQKSFYQTNITSLDLSQATSLTTIEANAFSNCSKLFGKIIFPNMLNTIGTNAFAISGISGDLFIPSSVTSIGVGAFENTNITSLDLSQATGLINIGANAFSSAKLTGKIIFPKSLNEIGANAFTNLTLDDLYFLSEIPPTFNVAWYPTSLTGKVYVPSEGAKQAYLGAPNFGFSEEKTEIGLPPEPTPEPTPKRINIGLILGLLIGLGIPVILATGFGIWYLTKKKKTTVKI